MITTPEGARAAAEAAGIPPEATFLLAPAALLGTWLVAELLLRIVRAAAAASRASQTHLDDVIAGALQGPIRLTGLSIGACLAVLVSPAPLAVRIWADRAIVVILALSGTIVAGRLLGGLILEYGPRAKIFGGTRLLLRRAVTAAVYVFGGLFLLDNLGIEITPLLTTLGLAGLAVALALQDSLSNFFAGIHIGADRPLDQGHYVRLDELNVEGYVAEVGWRTTKIRTLANNLVVIPNSRVAQAVVTDYDLPEPRMSLLVRIPVEHTADPTRVQEIVLSEAKAAAGEIPGLLTTPEPFVRFIPGFTDTGLEFTLICQVQTFVDQYLAQHRLRERITARFRKEGIRLAAPVRRLEVTSAGLAMATPSGDGTQGIIP